LILAVVMMVALAGIAIPAMAMERTEVENGPPVGNGAPNISVTKNIWNGSDLVDTIVANVGDTLTFNVTISNTGTSNLTDIWVTDTLSDSLTYNDNATVNGTNREPDILASPDYTWNLSDFAPFEPGDSINITFSANVTSCGVDVNTMTANATDGYDTVYGNDTATVNTLQPSLNVTKQVWNGSDWVDEVIAALGDPVTFNMTIHNTGICCNLTNMIVTDILPTSLTYDNNAIIIHPGNVTQSKEPDIVGNTYTWNLSDFAPLGMSQNMSISFSANVTSCGVDVNEVTVNATCDGNEEYLAYGEDTATVSTFSGKPPIGGEVYPVNRVAILAPWIALAVLFMVGLIWLTFRYRRNRSQA
jgi:uncharacterized repeat protein (TIGR01451 family)